MVTYGVGGMRDYLQFLLAPLFLEVILVTKEVSEQPFSKIFNFGCLPPRKPYFGLVSEKVAVCFKERYFTQHLREIQSSNTDYNVKICVRIHMCRELEKN